MNETIEKLRHFHEGAFLLQDGRNGIPEFYFHMLRYFIDGHY